MRSQRGSTSQHVDVFLSAYPEQVRETASAARRLLIEMLPGVAETVDESAELLGYSYGPGVQGGPFHPDDEPNRCEAWNLSRLRATGSFFLWLFAPYARAVTALIDRMSQEKTFVTCLMDQRTEDPNKFTRYERWREPSLKAFLKNQMKEYRKVYEEMLPSFLRSPRTTMVLRSVRAWQN